jgi:hypothetical protein
MGVGHCELSKGRRCSSAPPLSRGLSSSGAVPPVQGWGAELGPPRPHWGSGARDRQCGSHSIHGRPPLLVRRVIQIRHRQRQSRRLCCRRLPAYAKGEWLKPRLRTAVLVKGRRGLDPMLHWALPPSVCPFVCRHRAFARGAGPSRVGSDAWLQIAAAPVHCLCQWSRWSRYLGS